MTVLSGFGNHVWQSTLFAAGVALLVTALRRQRAETRHRLWLAASLKFLVPMAPLIELGSRIEWRSAPAAALPVSAAVTHIGEPFAGAAAASAATVSTGTSWMPWIPGAIWLAGFVAVLWRWGRQWRRARAAVRGATPLPIDAPIPVLSSAAGLEPGVFGVLRPVLLLPEGIGERLSAGQLRAVLAHEFCHARRRDNLWAATHIVVEAVFWFHPAAWWIGARMVEERERACDEDVVRRGNDPEVYASGIIDVCRLCLEPPLACAQGVTGADLEQRIRSIMAGGAVARLTAAHKALLACAAAAAVAGPIAVGALGQARTPLRFEVASIKRQKRDVMKGAMELLPGGGLRMGGVTVKQLVALAYDVREHQIVGGPKWLDQDTYSLLAKAERTPSGNDQPVTTAPGTTAWERLRERVQTLLAERCRLVARKDSSESSGYEMVVAKGGFKLNPTTNPLPAGTVRSFGVINGRSGTMRMLASVLTNYVGKPVVDKTGQTGNYDYQLKYADDSAGPESPVSEGASIFTALQEQLGVKLEPARVAVATIVIERVERPSEN